MKNYEQESVGIFAGHGYLLSVSVSYMGENVTDPLFPENRCCYKEHKRNCILFIRTAGATRFFAPAQLLTPIITGNLPGITPCGVSERHPGSMAGIVQGIKTVNYGWQKRFFVVKRLQNFFLMGWLPFFFLLDYTIQCAVRFWQAGDAYEAMRAPWSRVK